MKPHPPLILALLGGLSPLHAASVSLASAMDGGGYMSEDKITGSFARINLGNGSPGSAGSHTGDADGVYNIDNIGLADPGALWGTPIDLFPREADFLIGSLTFDESLVSTTGASTVPITGIDLGAFWTSDASRLGGPGSVPNIVTDISDYAIGLWLFNGSGGISFGGLDAGDTLTFTDGVLTSIDLHLTTAFSASFGGMEAVWEGVFSITGDAISYQIDDTVFIPGYSEFVGEPRFVADLTGTVSSVGVYSIPEPASALLGSFGLLALLRRRR